MLSFHPRIATVVVLLALVMGLSGCGGSSGDADTSPSVSPSVAPTSASPSTKPKKKAKPKPLSRFEGNPAVKVLRAWASAYAHDINHQRYSLDAAQRYESPVGKTFMLQVIQDDRGKYYPGPVPFTPVSVHTSGDHTDVTVCLWEHGFTLTRAGHHRTAKKAIGPTEFQLSKIGGAWRVDRLVAATADCSGIKVKGVKW